MISYKVAQYAAMLNLLVDIAELSTGKLKYYRHYSVR
jgi:hypothetical protein